MSAMTQTSAHETFADMLLEIEPSIAYLTNNKKQLRRKMEVAMSLSGGNSSIIKQLKHLLLNLWNNIEADVVELINKDLYFVEIEVETKVYRFSTAPTTTSRSYPPIASIAPIACAPFGCKGCTGCTGCTG